CACGATEGGPLGHSWKDANCTQPKTCAGCGATEGSALGHSWKDANCTQPKTCSTCGATEGAALGHTFVDASCTTCQAPNPNYQDPRCYTGTNIKTVTEVTGCKCTGSYKDFFQTAVSKDYLPGCKKYSYCSYSSKQDKLREEQYTQCFQAYINYLNTLGYECIKAQPSSFNGLGSATYIYKISDSLYLHAEWFLSSYSYSTDFSVCLTPNKDKFLSYSN
ncbi:MAG: hypothetical protein IKU24_05340, partial [Clostridia bacterium]|nr:hypothetical protein [Clostridia bacterium]